MSEADSAPGGLLVMLTILDLLVVAMAVWAFSIGAQGPGTGILALAVVLTGVDLWLYRRGSL